MFAEERQKQIFSQIKKEGSAEVSRLAKEFGKSEETIRRDLKAMERYGMIKRTRGGATLTEDSFIMMKEPPTMFRQGINTEKKQMIAKRAAEFVQNNDVILLDDSTTVFNILRYLPKEYYLTIITNSIPVINQLQNMDNDAFWTVICLGGILKSRASSLTGFLARDTLMTFRPKKLFMSCGGVDWKGNITEGSLSTVELKKEFVARCEEIYLLLDDSKVGNPSTVNLMEMREIDNLVVSKMDSVRMERMQKMGAKKITVV